MGGGCMAEEAEIKPRLIIESDPFRADKFTSCDECMTPVPEGTIMRKAMPSWQTQRTDNFTSLDGRELSTDLRMNICPACVVRNDLKREPRNNTQVKDAIATSKPAYADMLKKKTPVRKKK
jgi:hypothetical protein